LEKKLTYIQEKEKQGLSIEIQIAIIMRISGGIQSCKTLSVLGVLKNPHKKQQYKGKDVSLFKIREIQ
jgi:hypothetical protein